MRKRKLGDRYDGFIIKSKVDPFFKLIPHIMRTRVDSMVFFEEEIDLEPIEKFIRAKRNSGIKDIKILHIIMSSFVRTVSQKPQLNRFVIGRKIFARNHLCLSLAIKRGLAEDSEETVIKPDFDFSDTIYDVKQKLNDAYVDSTSEGARNEADKLSKLIGSCPNFFIHFLVFFFRNLDKIGLMPKAIAKISPFHSTAFFTDVGSIGVGSVYHHIYEFGTTSIFLAIGKKETKLELNSDGSISKKKYLVLKIVLDERICEGYLYSSAMRQFKRILQKPEQLESPPLTFVEDPLVS